MGTQVVSSGPVAQADFATTAAAAYCNGITQCCTAQDLSTCNATLVARIEMLMAAYEPTKYEFDATAAGLCVEAYRVVGTSCGVDRVAFAKDCRLIWKGLLPTGAACAADAECAPQTGFRVTCLNGLCEADPEPETSPPGVAGEMCTLSCDVDVIGNASCYPTANAPMVPRQCFVEDNLWCDEETSLCAPLPTGGQHCWMFCAPNFYCDNNTETCVAQVATGSCESAFGIACLPTSYCSQQTFQCIPKVADGSACTLRDECLGGFCTEGRCHSGTIASQQQCNGLL
jgi:hypothetical protein